MIPDKPLSEMSDEEIERWIRELRSRRSTAIVRPTRSPRAPQVGGLLDAINRILEEKEEGDEAHD